MPFAASTAPERYEGMLVRFPQSLVISEYFNYDRFGEIVLALPLDGESRPFTPTAIDAPGAPANARTYANSLQPDHARRRARRSNPTVLRHPNGNPFSLTNIFRGGDTVRNAVGVARLRLQPLPHPADRAGRLHADEPAAGGARRGRRHAPRRGDEHAQLLRHRATTPTGDPLDNKCGGNAEPRVPRRGLRPAGRIQPAADKLIAALAGLNADVIGLNELENTPGRRPAATRTASCRAQRELGAGTYAAIDTGVIGTDAIQRRADLQARKVTPVGDFKILTSAIDPRFIDTKSRPVAGADVRGERDRRPLHRRRQPPEVEGVRLRRHRRPRRRRRPGQLQRHPHERRAGARRLARDRPDRAAATPTS